MKSDKKILLPTVDSAKFLQLTEQSLQSIKSEILKLVLDFPTSIASNNINYQMKKGKSISLPPALYRIIKIIDHPHQNFKSSLEAWVSISEIFVKEADSANISNTGHKFCLEQIKKMNAISKNTYKYIIKLTQEQISYIQTQLKTIKKLKKHMPQAAFSKQTKKLNAIAENLDLKIIRILIKLDDTYSTQMTPTEAKSVDTIVLQNILNVLSKTIDKLLSTSVVIKKISKEIDDEIQNAKMQAGQNHLPSQAQQAQIDNADVVSPDDQSLNNLQQQLQVVSNNIQSVSIKLSKLMGKVKPYDESRKKVKDKSFSTELLNDLHIIFDAMLLRPTSIEVRWNKVDELVVKVDSQELNLTQILLHQPNMADLKVTPIHLDAYANLLINDKNPLIGPFIPGLGIISNKSVDTLIQNLMDVFSSNNDDTFDPNTQIAECFGVGTYLTFAYLIINHLLRTSSISKKFFSEIPSSDNAVSAHKEFEESLRKKITGADISLSELNKILLIVLPTIVVATKGLHDAKHPLHDPDQPFDVVEGRGTRGGVGSWADNRIKYYKMAYIGGTPIFDTAFSSASLDPAVANKFLEDPDPQSKKVISKVITFDFDNPTNSILGTNVSSLSPFPEREFLVPPCVQLTRFSPIKHLDHYDNPPVSEKATIYCVEGSSPLNEFYSSDIQKLRDRFISLYENQEWEQMLAGPAHTAILDDMTACIRASINLLSTQFRKHTVLIADHIDLNNQVQLAEIYNKIPADVGGAYIFTKDNQIVYFGDNVCQVITNVDPNDFNFMIDCLNLNELHQLKPNDLQLTKCDIDLVKLRFIKEMTHQKDIRMSFTIQESLSYAQRQLARFQSLYDQLDPQNKQSLSTLSKQIDMLFNMMNEIEVNYRKTSVIPDSLFGDDKKVVDQQIKTDLPQNRPS